LVQTGYTTHVAFYGRPSDILLISRIQKLFGCLLYSSFI
jgi:hypothetical protein